MRASRERGGDRQRSERVVQVGRGEVAGRASPTSPVTVCGQSSHRRRTSRTDEHAGERPVTRRRTCAPTRRHRCRAARRLARPGDRPRPPRSVAPQLDRPDRPVGGSGRIPGGAGPRGRDRLPVRQARRGDGRDLDGEALRREGPADADRPRIRGSGATDEDDSPRPTRAASPRPSRQPAVLDEQWPRPATPSRIAIRTAARPRRRQAARCLVRARRARRSDRRRDRRQDRSGRRGRRSRFATIGVIPGQVGRDDWYAGRHRLEQLVRRREAVVQRRRLDRHRGDVGGRDPVDAAPTGGTAGRTRRRPDQRRVGRFAASSVLRARRSPCRTSVDVVGRMRQRAR